MRRILAAACLIVLPSSLSALEQSDTTQFDCKLMTAAGESLAFRGSSQGDKISANFTDLPAASNSADRNDREVLSAGGEQGLCITSGRQVCYSRWTVSMNDGQLIDIEMQDWYDRGVASVVLTSRWNTGRHSDGAPLALGYCSTQRTPASAGIEEKQ